MKLTIAIPNYNWWENLIRAIKSCLNIDLLHTDYEILIVDNCSTDNSVFLVNELKKNIKNIRLIENNKNYGRVWNWNKALEEASWYYILFLFSNDQINSENNIKNVLDIMKNKKIKISKSNKLNLSDSFEWIIYNEVLYLREFILKNFNLLSSLPFWPIQTLIFDLNYLRKNNIKFNINNEITADHEFWLDILKIWANLNILKTNSFNILFDDINKNRFHKKLSYFDMLSSEFDLIMKNNNYKLISSNKKFIVKKYLTRINYICLLNKFSFWKMFPNFKKDDKDKLYNFFISKSLLSSKNFIYLNILSYFDFNSFIWFLKFKKSKWNSI